MVSAWQASERVDDNDHSVGELLTELSSSLRRLINAEIQLALTEVRRKAKRVRLGAGALGMAGLLGLIGLGVLAAAAVLALAQLLAGWLAALLVGAAILVVAGMIALVGRFALRSATPMRPEWMITSVREDIETITKGVHR